MMTKLKLVLAAAAGWALTTQVALAAPAFPVPEPGSLALVGVAIAALVAVGRKRK